MSESAVTKAKHFLMARSREAKYREFIRITQPKRSSTILDAGVADIEYSPHDNYLEKKYPYPKNISALSIYSLEVFRKRYPEIKPYSYDGGRFPFESNAFDIVHSNAVIEHVGGRKEQLLFIKEMIRVGRVFFFSTPAREFPIEMHTGLPLIHWLPKRTFGKLLLYLGRTWAAGNYMNLLTKRDLISLMRSVNVVSYRLLTLRFALVPLHYLISGH